MSGCGDAAPGRGERVDPEHRAGGAAAGDHEVDVGHLGGEVGAGGQGPDAAGGGERPGTAGGGVHADVAGAAGLERGQRRARVGAGADEHAADRRTSRAGPRSAMSRATPTTERPVAPSPVRLSTSARDAGGRLEQGLEAGRRGAVAAGGGQRAADLPGDLPLADDHRVEPAGDGEQVGGGVGAGPDAQVGVDLRRGVARPVGDGLRRPRRGPAGRAAASSTSRYSSNRLHVARTTAPDTNLWAVEPTSSDATAWTSDERRSSTSRSRSW